MSAVLDRKRQLLDQIFKGGPDELRRATVRSLWRGQDESEQDYRQRISGDTNFKETHWKAWLRKESETEDNWLARQRNNLSSHRYSQKRSPEMIARDNASARQRKRQRRLPPPTADELPMASTSGTRERDLVTRTLDLREGLDEYSGKSNVVKLVGPRTTVAAFTPWLDKIDAPGNALYKEASLVECLMTRAHSLTEKNTEGVLVLEKITDAEHEQIRRALAEGRAVYCDEGGDHTTNPELTADWVQRHWRVDTTAKVRQVHSMRNKAATQEPDAPADAVQYLERRVSIEDILTPTGAKGDHIYLLDMPLFSSSLSGNLVALNDAMTAWQETFDVQFLFVRPNGSSKEEAMTRQQCQDQLWGLFHQAMTNTRGHHDAIGQVTVITGQAGYKIWFVFLHPDGSSVSRAELGRWQTSLNEAENEDPPTYPTDIIVKAFLIGPKTTLIQPPGTMHAVYTPVPSFTNGASFCMYETMHLTERSRFIDTKYGDVLTNVDHDDIETYEIFLRMMCGLRSFRSELPRKALLALALMVIFPTRYFSTHNKDARDISTLRTRARKCPLRLISVEMACVLCQKLGISVIDVSVVLEGHTKVENSWPAGLKPFEVTLALEMEKECDSVDLDSTGIRAALIDVVERARERADGV